MMVSASAGTRASLVGHAVITLSFLIYEKEVGFFSSLVCTSARFTL